MNERELLRHLSEGGADVWNPADPPTIDLATITGAEQTPAATAEVAPTPAPTPAQSPSEPGRPARPARPSRRARASRSALRLQTLTLPSLGLAAGAMACVGIGLAAGALLFGGDPAAPTPQTRAAASPSTAPTTPGTSTAGTATPGAPGAPVAPERSVALQRLDAAPSGAMAVATITSRSGGTSLTVRVVGLPALQRGAFYELWALGAKGRMVSLGTIAIDRTGAGAVTVQVPVSLRRFPVLDISLEHPDGDPTHSGDSLLRAPV